MHVRIVVLKPSRRLRGFDDLRPSRAFPQSHKGRRARRLLETDTLRIVGFQVVQPRLVRRVAEVGIGEPMRIVRSLRNRNLPFRPMVSPDLRIRGPRLPLIPIPIWDWNEWKTWSAYSKVWTHHWSKGEIPVPEAPYDTHWLANPYLGHSPYQPWLNNLKPNYPKGLKKASSSPALASLTKGVRRTEIIEPAKPPTGLENYDANVQKLLHSSAKKAARHYVAGMLEDKIRVVLDAMERPALDPSLAAW